MILRYLGSETRDWIHVALVERSNEPLFSIAGGEFLDYLGDLAPEKHFGALSCIVMWRAVEKQKDECYRTCIVVSDFQGEA